MSNNTTVNTTINASIDATVSKAGNTVSLTETLNTQSLDFEKDFENIRRIYDIKIQFEKYHAAFIVKNESANKEYNKYILVLKQHFDEFQRLISFIHEAYGIETWSLIAHDKIKDDGIIAEFYEETFWAYSQDNINKFFKTKNIRQKILKKSLKNEQNNS